MIRLHSHGKAYEKGFVSRYQAERWTMTSNNNSKGETEITKMGLVEAHWEEGKV